MPVAGSIGTVNKSTEVLIVFTVTGDGVVIGPQGVGDPIDELHVNEEKLAVKTGVPSVLIRKSSTTTFGWLLVVVFFTVITY